MRKFCYSLPDLLDDIVNGTWKCFDEVMRHVGDVQNNNPAPPEPDPYSYRDSDND